MTTTDEIEWFVVLYRVETLAEDGRFGPFTSEAVANKADEGLHKNLDQKLFYTRVVRKRRVTKTLGLR